MEYSVKFFLTLPGNGELLIDNKQHYKFLGKNIDVISLIKLDVVEGKFFCHEDWWDKKPLWNRDTIKLPLVGRMIEITRRGSMLATHAMLRFGKDPTVYPYLIVVLNFSQTWALYCLVQFYSVRKEKLAPTKHLAKFLVFKSIVFLTWWQGIAVAFLFSMGAFKGALAQELKTCMQDYIICIEMGVAAVVHLYVFSVVPYKWGERCVRNVAVLDDYASLGSPPDPEEFHDCERSTRIRLACHDEREKCLNFPQSVRDMVLGSGEIIVDDMKYTVSHVMKPVERGIAKINKTFHEISENVKRHEALRKNSKDDSYLIPMSLWTREFSKVQDSLVEGSVSGSGMSSAKKLNQRASASRNKSGR